MVQIVVNVRCVGHNATAVLLEFNIEELYGYIQGVKVQVAVQYNAHTSIMMWLRKSLYILKYTAFLVYSTDVSQLTKKRLHYQDLTFVEGLQTFAKT